MSIHNEPSQIPKTEHPSSYYYGNSLINYTETPMATINFNPTNKIKEVKRIDINTLIQSRTFLVYGFSDDQINSLLPFGDKPSNINRIESSTYVLEKEKNGDFCTIFEKNADPAKILKDTLSKKGITIEREIAKEIIDQLPSKDKIGIQSKDKQNDYVLYIQRKQDGSYDITIYKTNINPQQMLNAISSNFKQFENQYNTDPNFREKWMAFASIRPFFVTDLIHNTGEFFRTFSEGLSNLIDSQINKTITVRGVVSYTPKTVNITTRDNSFYEIEILPASKDFIDFIDKLPRLGFKDDELEKAKKLLDTKRYQSPDGKYYTYFSHAFYEIRNEDGASFVVKRTSEGFKLTLSIEKSKLDSKDQVKVGDWFIQKDKRSNTATVFLPEYGEKKVPGFLKRKVEAYTTYLLPIDGNYDKISNGIIFEGTLEQIQEILQRFNSLQGSLVRTAIEKMREKKNGYWSYGYCDVGNSGFQIKRIKGDNTFQLIDKNLIGKTFEEGRIIGTLPYDVREKDGKKYLSKYSFTSFSPYIEDPYALAFKIGMVGGLLEQLLDPIDFFLPFVKKPDIKYAIYDPTPDKIRNAAFELDMWWIDSIGTGVGYLTGGATLLLKKIPSLASKATGKALWKWTRIFLENEISNGGIADLDKLHPSAISKRLQKAKIGEKTVENIIKNQVGVEEYSNNPLRALENFFNDPNIKRSLKREVAEAVTGQKWPNIFMRTSKKVIKYAKNVFSEVNEYLFPLSSNIEKWIEHMAKLLDLRPHIVTQRLIDHFPSSFEKLIKNVLPEDIKLDIDDILNRKSVKSARDILFQDAAYSHIDGKNLIDYFEAFKKEVLKDIKKLKKSRPNDTKLEEAITLIERGVSPSAKGRPLNLLGRQLTAEGQLLSNIFEDITWKEQIKQFIKKQINQNKSTDLTVEKIEDAVEKACKKIAKWNDREDYLKQFKKFIEEDPNISKEIKEAAKSVEPALLTIISRPSAITLTDKKIPASKREPLNFQSLKNLESANEESIRLFGSKSSITLASLSDKLDQIMVIPSRIIYIEDYLANYLRLTDKRLLRFISQDEFESIIKHRGYSSNFQKKFIDLFKELQNEYQSLLTSERIPKMFYDECISFVNIYKKGDFVPLKKMSNWRVVKYQKLLEKLEILEWHQKRAELIEQLKNYSDDLATKINQKLQENPIISSKELDELKVSFPKENHKILNQIIDLSLKINKSITLTKTNYFLLKLVTDESLLGRAISLLERSVEGIFSGVKEVLIFIKRHPEFAPIIIGILLSEWMEAHAEGKVESIEDFIRKEIPSKQPPITTRGGNATISNTEVPPNQEGTHNILIFGHNIEVGENEQVLRTLCEKFKKYSGNDYYSKIVSLLGTNDAQDVKEYLRNFIQSNRITQIEDDMVFDYLASFFSFLNSPGKNK